MKTLLFEDQHLKVYHRPGTTSYRLATFSNYGFNAERGVFWAEQFCDKENIDAIGFVAKASNWFPAVSMNVAMALLGALSSRPVVTYGHSQGGYAALKYSRALKAAGVIACAPQYTIRPGAIVDDQRFTQHYLQDLHDKMEVTADDLHGNATIIYDPLEPLDRRHVDLIANEASASPGIRFHVPYMGHEIMEIMTTRAVIVGFIAASLEGSYSTDLSRHVREAKKRSHRYGIKLAEALIGKRKSRTAVRVLDSVSARTRGIVIDRDQLPVSLISARAYMGSRMPGKAAEHMQLAISRQPENPHLQAFYASCLLGNGQLLAAASAYETAVGLQPGNAQYRRDWEAVRARLACAEAAGT